MTKDHSPILLTGNVYANEHLARQFSEYKAPGSFLRGDIVVHSHLDERGRKNLELRTAKKRLTRKTRYLTLSGYFTALLFDGEGWRTFHIDRLVDSDGWYTSQRFKEMKMHGVVWKLSRLAGRTATWGEDHAYEVLPVGQGLATTKGADGDSSSRRQLAESTAVTPVTAAVTGCDETGPRAAGSQLLLF